jgi:hypothetical protein
VPQQASEVPHSLAWAPTHPQDKELYHMVLKAMVCTPDVQEAALKDNPVVKVRHG